jgi:hypothetical protein
LLVKGRIKEKSTYEEYPKFLRAQTKKLTIISNMPLSFTTDPFEGPETVLNDDLSIESDDGSEGTGHGSNVSASEFDGDLNQDLPAHILFSEMEYRCQVTPYHEATKVWSGCVETHLDCAAAVMWERSGSELACTRPSPDVTSLLME